MKNRCSLRQTHAHRHIRTKATNINCRPFFIWHRKLEYSITRPSETCKSSEKENTKTTDKHILLSHRIALHCKHPKIMLISIVNVRESECEIERWNIQFRQFPNVNQNSGSISLFYRGKCAVFMFIFYFFIVAVATATGLIREMPTIFIHKIAQEIASFHFVWSSWIPIVLLVHAIGNMHNVLDYFQENYHLVLSKLKNGQFRC